MNRSISPTLEIRRRANGDRICCRNCGYDLAPEGRPWKQAAAFKELSTDETSLEGAADRAATVVRLFVCRGCAALLDSETALPGDPFLDDVVES